MPNIKSSKKRARQSIKRRHKNLARRSSIKTAVKKVLTALEIKDVEQAKILLKDAESQIARARGKKIMHAKTASRKVSRLAKKVHAAARAEA